MTSFAKFFRLPSVCHWLYQALKKKRELRRMAEQRKRALRIERGRTGAANGAAQERFFNHHF